MFVTPAFAQASVLGGSNVLLQFMPLVLIVVIMYFLIIRPQRQRIKKHEEMVRALRRGDTVVTSGGLIGKVTKVVDDSEIEVQFGEGMKSRVIRSMIQEVRTKSEPVKDSD